MAGFAMISEEQALSVLEAALRGSPADQTELVLLTERTEVTRYANSEIHQNVQEMNSRVAVRVAVGQATARVFTNSLELAALRQAIADATSLARLQAPNPRFRALPSPGTGYPAPTSSSASYFDSTADISAEARAAAVGHIIESALSTGLGAFGTLRTATSELAVVSSMGIRSYASFTTAYLKALIEGPQGAGFADALDRDFSRIDPGKIAAEAIAKCVANHDQMEIEPGEYEAIFEPDAVADMVRYPVVRGMGARQFLDGQSFMSGRIGEQVAREVVSIWDDPTDTRCLPIAIDYEGLPATRVEILRDGVALGPVYDSETATEAGTKSTGHASSPFTDFAGGPSADHVVMTEGDSSVEEMIRNVKHGVWVTRFHYTHRPDGKRVIATGTTRDGTFLIREGEVAGALKNLRFEMPVLDLLSSMQEGGKGKLCQDWWTENGMDSTNFFVPPMRFGACRFTGVTTF